MPDWVSHILIGLIFAEIFNIRMKSLVLLGSLLPDFLVKIYLLNYFFYIGPNIIFVTQLYHSPVMGFIISGLLVPLFKYDWKKTYLYITAGFMLHLAADSFTKQYYDGILLYPFSHSFFSFNWLWADKYWIVMVPLIAAYAAIRLYKKKYIGRWFAGR